MRVDCAPPPSQMWALLLSTQDIFCTEMWLKHMSLHTLYLYWQAWGKPKEQILPHIYYILRHHVAFRLLHASVLQVKVLWVRTVLYLETLDDIDFAQSLTSILTACPSRICIHVLCGSLLYLAGDAVTRCPIHYLLAAFYGTMCGFYWTFIHVSIVWYKPLIITF